MARSQSAAGEQVRARAWVEEVSIPTYLVGAPNRHPMFLDKRVYQGSSGRVYPYPMIDRLSDRPVDERHRAILLENRYLKLMVLPAFGGRIQYGYDKTNDYAFLYHNHVIKPALVGLAGPWLSGGIEFNWPQHHRPGTYCPVDFTIAEEADGRVTVWLSEIEPMWHVKGTLGLTLHPDRAYLEIVIRMFNPTPLPQSVHLWTNPAVHVNDDYQSVFPPDVQAVYDHGKRDVSQFPIARGTYYKMDYSRGVDISWYKNIPVPTSYMAATSRYDFMGGYDHGRRAGVLHVADHHVVPGKKQWVWGSGEFGRAWDRNLTDEDGPYAELMCGVFADNQPDFCWLQPYEEKEVRQYFLPYKAIGYVRNATIDAAVSFDLAGDIASIGVYATSIRSGARVRVWARGGLVSEVRCDLAPETPWCGAVRVPAAIPPHDLHVEVIARDGRRLVDYRPEPPRPEAVPDPATAIPEPAALPTTEALYLAGLHLEQYRHATREPEAYYREGVRRDPSDSRCQHALGRLLLRRGQFAAAEAHARVAIASLARHNANPYDGEPSFTLGLALAYQQKDDEAYAAFAKATWNAAWHDAASFHLAQIAARRGDFDRALAHVDRALTRNDRNQKAVHLRALVLRRLGRAREAQAIVDAAIQRDPLDFWVRNERLLLCRESRERGASATAAHEQAALLDLMRGDPHTHLEIAAAYADAGAYDEAIDLLRRAIRATDAPGPRAPGHVAAAGMPSSRPMLFYTAALYAARAGRRHEADDYLDLAAAQPTDGVFPNSLDALTVLHAALVQRPRDARAALYLGNLWYDKRQAAEAIACWERAADADPTLSTAHRNLAIAHFNVHRDAPRALAALERAFTQDPSDARLLFELDLLKKRCGTPLDARLAMLRAHGALVQAREDLLLALITLLNTIGDHDEALRLLLARTFHPWEGGEGKIPNQFVVSCLELAKDALAAHGSRPRNGRAHNGRARNGRAHDARAHDARAQDGRSHDRHSHDGRSHDARSHETNVAIEWLRQARTWPSNLGEGKLLGTPEHEVLYWLGVAHDAANEPVAARAWWTQASTGIRRPEPAVYYNDGTPDAYFYQGLACARLGDRGAAREHFETLVHAGRAHLDAEPIVDYFAVSLPDLLVFEDDLARRHEITGRYLMALGHWGLGRAAAARDELARVIDLDPSHQAAVRHLRLFTGPLAPRVRVNAGGAGGNDLASAGLTQADSSDAAS